jgi:hypothetical protein
LGNYVFKKAFLKYCMPLEVEDKSKNKNTEIAPMKDCVMI